jgi:hypothetical protein
MTTHKDITIIQGDTYVHTITFDESQSGYSFAATLNAIALVDSMASDNVTLTLTLSAAQTAALVADGTTIYKWRLIRTNDSDSTVYTVMQGTAKVVDV